MIAPADKSKLMMKASSLVRIPSLILVPHPVGISFVLTMSFMATGNPCKGPRGFPESLYSSACFALSNKYSLSK